MDVKTRLPTFPCVMFSSEHQAMKMPTLYQMRHDATRLSMYVNYISDCKRVAETMI